MTLAHGTARLFPAGDPDLVKIGMRWEQALTIQLVEPSTPPEVVGAEGGPVESVVIAPKREAQVTQRPPA